MYVVFVIYSTNLFYTTVNHVKTSRIYIKQNKILNRFTYYGLPVYTLFRNELWKSGSKPVPLKCATSVLIFPCLLFAKNENWVSSLCVAYIVSTALALTLNVFGWQASNISSREITSRLRQQLVVPRPSPWLVDITLITPSRYPKSVNSFF